MSANGNGPLALLPEPGDFLVAVFALSPTLWTIVFVVFFISASFTSAVASAFRALRFCPAPRLVTLFPDGSPTPRPTFPR
jgi:hypothetical protein